MPELPTYSPDNPLGTPFRKEIPIEDFDKVHTIRKEIATAKGLFDSSEGKPIVSSLMQEILMNPETPNEVKLEIFQGQIDILDSDRETETNKVLASALIDSIRSQSDTGIRIRLQAKLSHHLQTHYESHWSTPEARIASIARRAAFQELAHGTDTAQVHKNWSRHLLEPQGLLQIFNELYERETDLIVTPRIVEEITKESEGLEPEIDQESRKLFFTGNLIRLKPPSLPILEKIEQYKKITGRDLPVFITQSLGLERIHTQFPADLTRKLAELLDNYRSDTPSLSRDQIFEEANRLQSEFMERMNKDQREEIENGANVEVRFSTTRDSAVEPTPDIEEPQQDIHNSEYNQTDESNEEDNADTLPRAAD